MATLAALSLASSAAHAAGVGTYVENYSALSGNRNFAGYNFSTDAFANHFGSGGGASTYTACRADVPCSTTGGGTPDHVGNATASYNFASLSDTDQGGFSSGSGFARADLSTGALGGSAEGTNRSAFGQGSGIGTRAFSTFSDTVLFTIADATAATVTNIGVNLALHGDMTRSALDTDPTVTSYLNFGGGLLGVAMRLDANGNPYLSGGANYWDSYTLTQAGDGFLFSGIYALRGTTSSVDVGEYLDVQCGNGAVCDYDSTAAFSLDLPSNVTFTSASGVFLSQAAGNGVPEPSTWILLIGGFGLAGVALRRRQVAAGAA